MHNGKSKYNANTEYQGAFSVQPLLPSFMGVGLLLILSQSTISVHQAAWFFCFTLVLGAFFLFTSPYASQRELRYRLPSYVWVVNFFVCWLSAAVLLHHGKNLAIFDLRPFLTMSFPIFAASWVGLTVVIYFLRFVRWLFQDVSDSWLHTIYIRPNEKWFVVQASFVIAIVSSLFFMRCGNSVDSNATPYNTAGAFALMRYPIPTEICQIYLSPMPLVNFPAFTNLVSLAEQEGKNSFTTILSITEQEGVNGSLISPLFTLWSTLMGIVLSTFLIERSYTYRLALDISAPQGVLAERTEYGIEFNLPMAELEVPKYDWLGIEHNHLYSFMIDENKKQQKKRRLTKYSSSILHDIPELTIPSEKNDTTSRSETLCTTDQLFTKRGLQLLRRCSNNNAREISKDINPKNILSMDWTTHNSHIPDFLPMVPWFSLQLTRTLLDMSLMTKVFAGIYDARIQEAALAMGSRAGGEWGQNATSYGPGVSETSIGTIGKKTKKYEISTPYFDHLSERKEVWFDWMADTGDGGNSTYSIASCLAAPELLCIVSDNITKVSSSSPLFNSEKSQRKMISLPRGDILLLGGDLAYPTPTVEVFEKRFFKPFEYAMEPPPWYDPAYVAINKPDEALGLDKGKGRGLSDYTGPMCFSIPGNHDWFDGLNCFTRLICRRNWLGGWLMPQQNSYFALKLPQGWWLFGLDHDLSEDIDIEQFKYFAHITDTFVGKDDAVIVCQHIPRFVLGYEQCNAGSKGHLTKQLIEYHIGDRVAIRLAGDIHHYTRHCVVDSNTLGYKGKRTGKCKGDGTDCRHINHSHDADLKSNNDDKTKSKYANAKGPTLIVSGGGGAFLHPTHTFSEMIRSCGLWYKRKVAYPTVEKSRQYGFQNFTHFRSYNWRFEIVGGISYFLLISSSLIRCTDTTQGIFDACENGTFDMILSAFMSSILDNILYAISDSTVSLITMATLLALCIGSLLSQDTLTLWQKLLFGFLHFFAHLCCAVALSLFVELALNIAVKYASLGSNGYGSLYKWFLIQQESHFPDSNGLRNKLELYTFGLYPLCIKYSMIIFDVPELMAVSAKAMCSDTSTRNDTLIFYASFFLYYWPLAAVGSSFVIGFFLYFATNILGILWDEGFSSLRIQHHKSFLRFHIKENGELEMFCIGVDKVPSHWRLNLLWRPMHVICNLLGITDEERKQGNVPLSHMLKHPSRWYPRRDEDDNIRKSLNIGEQLRVKCIDYCSFTKKVK